VDESTNQSYVETGHVMSTISIIGVGMPMARALENATLLELGLGAHCVKPTSFVLGVSVLS
jgi:hypothetical protein